MAAQDGARGVAGDPDAEAVERRLGTLATRPHVRAALSVLGRPGSRFEIATPAAVVDVGALERNIALMSRRCAAAAVGLRPHAKSHKSAAIAHRQLAAGAAGICCAKLAEAEALADAGVPRILVTSPVVSTLGAERAAALRARLDEFAVVVDHGAGVRVLDEAARRHGGALDVLIDLDVGLGRTGSANADDALRLADDVARAPGLALCGVQAYGGHWQHVPGASTRLEQVAKAMAGVAATVGALEDAGHRVELRTGGGTGTWSADVDLGVLNDVQPGSYVFMDDQYRSALGADVEGAYEQSLFVQATVVSANQPAWVTVDAGLKALATDAGPPVPTGAFARCAWSWFGDEHGLLVRPADGSVAVGQRVELIPPHCDPTVDRYDLLHFVRGDVLVDVVAVTARGCSQ